MAHKLNFFGSVYTEKALLNQVCKTVYRHILGKVSEVFNKQSRSTNAADTIRRKFDGLFKVHNATRWNSFFDALSTIRFCYTIKLIELNTVFTEFHSVPITADEAVFLKEFSEVKEPLGTIQGEDVNIGYIQGEDANISYILPTAHHLLEVWNGMSTRNRL